MSEYRISQIFDKDRRAVKELTALLDKEGIERDRNLDYTAGLYDEDYRLAATGSCFKNTLRCMAVDSSHQGEGLLNQIISHLIDYEYNRGLLHLFLYTKCDKALFFRDLGFYEIARVEAKVVFMENRRDGFSSYLAQLKAETEGRPAASSLDAQKGIGAVIMNANPFTLGHQYLLETAAAACSLLHIFIVSEDVSLVPLHIRRRLVTEGAAHLSNVVFHETGSYMISSATFPSYFLKDEETVIHSHAKLDLAIFKKIAAFLGITDRFVGEEPFSQVTGIYNQVMQEELSGAGIGCHIIPRKSGDANDTPISASSVRKLIHDGQTEAIKELVPESTYRYFMSEEAVPVIDAIREEADVIHY